MRKLEPFERVTRKGVTYEVLWAEDEKTFCHVIGEDGEPEPSVIFNHRPAVVMLPA